MAADLVPRRVDVIAALGATAGALAAKEVSSDGLGHRSSRALSNRPSGDHSGLGACGVDLYLDQQALDTTTPAGKLMFQITGAAEFERSMIRQRVNAGLKRAIEAGKQLGRSRIDPAIEKRIQNQLRTGKGMLKVAAKCGVGSGTVQRVAREMRGEYPFDRASAAA